MITQLKTIGPFTLALTLALITNFAYSAWTAPTGAPPSNNVAAPINLGAAQQIKQGNLGTDGNFRAGTGLQVGPQDNVHEGGELWLEQSNTGFNHLALDNYQGWFRVIRHGGPYASGAELLRVFPDGRLAAHQYCDIDGNNCSVGGGGGTAVNSCLWVYSGEGGHVDGQYHDMGCPNSRPIMTAWSCAAFNRLDGGCFAKCCSISASGVTDLSAPQPYPATLSPININW